MIKKTKTDLVAKLPDGLDTYGGGAATCMSTSWRLPRLSIKEDSFRPVVAHAMQEDQTAEKNTAGKINSSSTLSGSPISFEEMSDP